MKFLMLVCSDPDVDVPDDLESPEGWVEEMGRRGKRLTGDRLRPLAEARTVRVRGGKVRVTDGPFAETKEVIGGFDLLECDSMEQAIEVATAHPFAPYGTLELRQLWSS